MLQSFAVNSEHQNTIWLDCELRMFEARVSSREKIFSMLLQCLNAAQNMVIVWVVKNIAWLAGLFIMILGVTKPNNFVFWLDICWEIKDSIQLNFWQSIIITTLLREATTHSILKIITKYVSPYVIF